MVASINNDRPLPLVIINGLDESRFLSFFFSFVIADDWSAASRQTSYLVQKSHCRERTWSRTEEDPIKDNVI